MSVFTCPVCGSPLFANGKVYRCPGGHSYDIAKQGYVNLLLSQQSSSKRHGDDKRMLTARERFLSKGYYQPLLDVICGQLCLLEKEELTVLDAGCGEGWYLGGVAEALERAGKEVFAAGVDISRDGAAMTARKLPQAEVAVASVYRLPMEDESCDGVLNLFSPEAFSEYRRVLKPEGLLIRAFPLKNHLMGLKQVLYDRPIPNEEDDSVPEGFSLLGKFDLKYHIAIEPEDILDLFMMTPYYYKTGAEDQKKLEKITELSTDIQFRVLFLQK